MGFKLDRVPDELWEYLEKAHSVIDVYKMWKTGSKEIWNFIFFCMNCLHSK